MYTLPLKVKPERAVCTASLSKNHPSALRPKLPDRLVTDKSGARPVHDALSKSSVHFTGA